MADFWGTVKRKPYLWPWEEEEAFAGYAKAKAAYDAYLANPSPETAAVYSAALEKFSPATKQSFLTYLAELPSTRKAVLTKYGLTDAEIETLWAAMERGDISAEDIEKLNRIIKGETQPKILPTIRYRGFGSSTFGQEAQPVLEPQPWTGQVGRTRSEAAADYTKWGIPAGKNFMSSMELPESVSSIIGAGTYSGEGQRRWQEQEAPKLRELLEEQRQLASILPKEWAEFVKTVPDVWTGSLSGQEELEKAQALANSPGYQTMLGNVRKATRLQPASTLGQVYKGAMPEFESPNMKEYYESQGQPLYNEWLATDPIKNLLLVTDPAVRESMKMTEFGKYLKKYPWLEKYTEKTAGGRTTKERPTTRWLNY